MDKRWFGLSSFFLLLAACDGGVEPAGDDVDPDAPTYYQAVKPIVDAKCTQCHTDGGIAPFTLTSYQDLVDHGAEASLNVQLGKMPPWPPDADCNQYYGDRSLTE